MRKKSRGFVRHACFLQSHYCINASTDFYGWISYRLILFSFFLLPESRVYFNSLPKKEKSFITVCNLHIINIDHRGNTRFFVYSVLGTSSSLECSFSGDGNLRFQGVWSFLSCLRGMWGFCFSGRVIISRVFGILPHLVLKIILTETQCTLQLPT